MGTPQSANPNPYPTRNPHPAPNPTSNSTHPGAKPPSFEEVSKLFSLPLSDAAESLGICPSVLKKVCYENGLVRWPYRKFIAGKSIEEIKKDAAIEKERKLTASKVAGQRNEILASSAVSSSLALKPQNTSTGVLQESTTSRILVQQPTKDIPTDGPQNMLNSSMSKGTSPISDEFKYGFPSSGLSSVSYRWWGNKGDAVNPSQPSANEDSMETKQHCNDSVDLAATAADLSLENVKPSEGKKNEMNAATEWAGLLTCLRKNATDEGRRALKIGVYKGSNDKMLDRTKKLVLLQIFKSSLPDEWGNLSSEG